jgi:hypothetical protein
MWILIINYTCASHNFGVERKVDMEVNNSALYRRIFSLYSTVTAITQFIEFGSYTSFMLNAVVIPPWSFCNNKSKEWSENKVNIEGRRCISTTLNCCFCSVMSWQKSIFASDYWQHHVTEKREWFLQDEKYTATIKWLHSMIVL